MEITFKVKTSGKRKKSGTNLSDLIGLICDIVNTIVALIGLWLALVQ